MYTCATRLGDDGYFPVANRFFFPRTCVFGIACRKVVWRSRSQQVSWLQTGLSVTSSSPVETQSSSTTVYSSSDRQSSSVGELPHKSLPSPVSGCTQSAILLAYPTGHSQNSQPSWDEGSRNSRVQCSVRGQGNLGLAPDHLGLDSTVLCL